MRSESQARTAAERSPDAPWRFESDPRIPVERPHPADRPSGLAVRHVLPGPFGPFDADDRAHSVASGMGGFERLERLASSWLLRPLDILLGTLVLGGFVLDPLAVSHGTAIVLVLQGFLLHLRGAAIRLALAVIATLAASALHAAAAREVAIQVPFVYGLAGLVAVIADSLRRSRATAVAALGEAERLALYDTLTGLPNRVLFHDRAQHALDLASREGEPVALLLIDLDRFKEVNDTFGHHVGDLLLREIGPHLREALRTGDTLARLGGDEFAVLLPAAGPIVAASVAERVIAALEQPIVIEGHSLAVGASIGIACSPEHARDGDTLLRRADLAMYVAKRTPGGYATYAAELDEGAAERLALMADLRDAIETDQLVLHYQPQADARSGALVAVEALVRWQHPRRGLLAPNEFLPLAERSGLMRRLSERVLRDAVRQARLWRDAGHDVRVAVNVYARDLLDARFPELVSDVLASEGLPPERLVLEITEGARVTDEGRATEAIATLRRSGVCVSIDDFGTGYSSMAYLARLGADEVKIDQSFVLRMGADRSAEAIVRATIDLAHVLGLAVVAEGVEDDATWARLRALGCDRVQGYRIGRPMPAEGIEAWAQRWHEPIAV